jgi:hypothetical protein
MSIQMHRYHNVVQVADVVAHAVAVNAPKVPCPLPASQSANIENHGQSVNHANHANRVKHAKVASHVKVARVAKAANRYARLVLPGNLEPSMKTWMLKPGQSDHVANHAKVDLAAKAVSDPLAKLRDVNQWHLSMTWTTKSIAVWLPN